MRAKNKGGSYRVVVHGLPHFCKKLSGILNCEGWNVRYHSRENAMALAGLANDLRRCDLAYTWGGRIDPGKFLWAARCLGTKNLVMLWSGSDVTYAHKDLAAGKLNSWIADKVHWAVSPWLAEEVRALGLQCEYVQASFVEPISDPQPLPEKFSVLTYLPSPDKADLYGWDQISEVARSCRSVEFQVVGLQEGQLTGIPPNVRVHGWAGDLAPFLERSSVLWRPVRHDGLSFMVLEALARGRHILYSYPFPGCVQVTSAAAARLEIERLLDRHDSKTLGLNQAGMEVISRDFNPAKVRADILGRWERIISKTHTLPARKLAEPTADV